MKSIKVIFLSFLVIGISICFSPLSWAVPSLQLYIPGATYDSVTETWIYPGVEYDFWAVGADSDPDVTILDVKLAASVKDDQTGSISIQPILDDGTLGNALIGVFFEGSIPVKGDGKELPTHGIYPSDYYQFSLGDFVLNEIGIPDFDKDYDPENPEATNAWGKITEYHVTVSGGFDWVHFDLFNHIEGENSALFAPFSHDADAEDGGGGTGGSVPEPATMLLVGIGIVGIGATFRKRFAK